MSEIKTEWITLNKTIEEVGRMDILADPRGAVFAGIGREGSAHPS